MPKLYSVITGKLINNMRPFTRAEYIVANDITELPSTTTYRGPEYSVLEARETGEVKISEKVIEEEHARVVEQRRRNNAKTNDTSPSNQQPVSR